MDPASTVAEPLENPVVDADGKPWLPPVAPEPEEKELGGVEETPSGSSDIPIDERPEIPMGDEVLGERVELTGLAAALPEAPAPQGAEESRESAPPPED